VTSVHKLSDNLENQANRRTVPHLSTML